MSSLTLPIQTATISISLLAAGSIATLSLFDVPLAQAQPASRALPSIRWLFSRGSHIFPTASVVTTVGFVYLAVNALPQGRVATQLLRLGTNGFKINGYLTAALLNFSIAPFTSMIMITNNFRLIELNENKGGARSEKSAQKGQYKAGERSAYDSVSGKGNPNQFTDLSGPQAKTEKSSTIEEDAEVQERIRKFGRQNGVRAVLCGFGGIIGLVAALS